MKKYLIKKYYHIKNSLKYLFKRNLSNNELWECAYLFEDGYMTERTYKRIIKRECK